MPEIGGIIVLHPNLHACPCLAGENLFHAASGGVGLELEKLEMYVVTCGFEVCEQVGEHSIEGGVCADIVAVQRI